MFNQLVDRIGFGWSMRAIAFMLLGLLLIANATTKSRLQHKVKPFKIMDFVVPFKEPRFLLLSMGSFFFFCGLFIPINFIILYGEYYGMSSSLAGYQLAILNAARYAFLSFSTPSPAPANLYISSVPGRIIPGWAGDRFGRFNVMILTILLSVVVVLALWIPSKSNAPIIVFSALYGFASGAFVSLVGPLVAQISDIRQIGVRNGSNFFVISFAALIGSPIAGALIDSDNGGYLYMQIFSGLVMAVGGICFIGSRYTQVGMKWKKV